jgi:NAD-dependent histone deacetylase SIR2
MNKFIRLLFEKIRRKMGNESSTELIGADVPPLRLKSRSIESVAEYIKSGKVRRIVVLTGAGVSTAAGIPDFRSPDTGLYANLARLHLPYAEAVFDISYFRENPEPFYTLAHELYPGKFRPTITHCFNALLAEKKLLHMLFTQNIDCLEREAGVPSEKIVEAHGSFATQRCIDCRTPYPDDQMHETIMKAEVPHCITPQCNGLVKPDIVFFGEALPDSFREHSPKVAQADLVLIMGTSLSVQPFASLPGFTPEDVPRVLFNLERVGGIGSRPDDVLVLDDCDVGTRKLADALGWRDELEALYKEVSGKGEGAAHIKAKEDTRTKDEKLEDEIAKLTSEVDHTLKISNGHKEYLEDQLKPKKTDEPAGTVKETSGVAGNESQALRPANAEEELSEKISPQDILFNTKHAEKATPEATIERADTASKVADELPKEIKAGSEREDPKSNL